MRSSIRERTTAETTVRVELALDGPPYAESDTGIGFFDHMLQQLATHGGMTLKVACRGDLTVDSHHTVEDCGIVLGQALAEAIGDRSGIQRYATMFIPMDETLAVTHLDVSGRPFFVFRADIPKVRLGDFDAEMCAEFFRAVAMQAELTLHMEVLYGSNVHHMVEALFKSFSHALRMAVRQGINGILSTKGVL